MKILILGSEGYLGKALRPYLEEHEVIGLDCRVREHNVQKVGSDSLTPVEYSPDYHHDVDYQHLKKLLVTEKPDAIVHFAEQPSAPFSMRSLEDAFFTQHNNIMATLELLWAVRETAPDTHIVHIGTMGVYGTPDEEIPEQDGPVAFDPPSFYHITKCTDALNFRKAAEWWGLKISDLHQGVVYGHKEGTRFDYDSYFGTVINRFVAQALAGHPLTVYGKGEQTRGFININDTLKCIEIALNNPPEGYRVFNQLTETFSMNYLAQKVQELTGAEIQHIDNPRIEREEHPYHVVHNRLFDHGLEPVTLEEGLPELIEQIRPYADNIKNEVIMPQVSWS